MQLACRPPSPRQCPSPTEVTAPRVQKNYQMTRVTANRDSLGVAGEQGPLKLLQLERVVCCCSVALRACKVSTIETLLHVALLHGKKCVGLDLQESFRAYRCSCDHMRVARDKRARSTPCQLVSLAHACAYAIHLTSCFAYVACSLIKPSARTLLQISSIHQPFKANSPSMSVAMQVHCTPAVAQELLQQRMHLLLNSVMLNG